LGLLLVLELAAAFSAFALKDDVERIFKTGLENSQAHYTYNATADNDKEITQGWDVMQNEVSNNNQPYKCKIGKISTRLILPCCALTFPVEMLRNLQLH
jgi:hypothetical protein